jgi:uncharacterized Zn-binding protein involved in type VI secretion
MVPRFRVALLGVLSVVTATLTVLPLAAAEAGGFQSQELLTSHVTLPLTDVRFVLADPTHHQLFVAGSQADADLVAVSPAGTVLSQIPLAGVTRMTLTADGSTVWAAVPSADEIAEIDTTSYVVTLHPTGAGSCPQSVARVGGQLWFSASAPGSVCGEQWEQLTVLDLSTGQTHPAFPVYPDGYYFHPMLHRIPGTDELLVGDPDGTDVVDTTGPSVVTHSTTARTDTPDLEFSPDHTSVFVYDFGTTLSLPDLTETDAVALLNYPPVTGDTDLLVTGDNQNPAVFDRTTHDQLNAISLSDLAGASVYPKRSVLLDGTLDDFAVYQTQLGSRLRMYVEPTPAVRAPDLSVEGVSPATVGHPVLLSGTLLAGGQPLAGVPVQVYESGGPLIATTTTDDTGAWAVSHTWNTIGNHTVLAVSDAGAGRKSAISGTYVTLQRQSAAMTLDGPTTAAPGDEADMTGTLTIDGQPAASKPVTWYAECTTYGDQRTITSGVTTTGPDGTYAFTFDPGRCAQVLVNAYRNADDISEGTGAQHALGVSWRVLDLQIPAPLTTYVGDGYQVSGAVTLDGVPAAGITVQGTVDTVPAGSLDATTDANGSFTFTSFDTPAAGTYHLHVSVDGTSNTLGDEVQQSIVVDRVPTALQVSRDPDVTEVGQEVTITGKLTALEGDVTDQPVTLVAADQWGAGQPRSTLTTVAQDGTFSFTDVPQAAGGTTYRVGYAGDSTFAAAPYATASVAVDPLAPGLTLTTDRHTYDPGDTATIHVGADFQGRVTLTEISGNGTRHQIYDGGIDPAQGLAFEVPMWRTRTFELSTPGDAAHSADTTSVLRTVRMLLRTSPGFVRSDPLVYSAGARPRWSAGQQPIRPRTCLHFVVQKRTSSGWRLVLRSSCSRTDDNGGATYRFVAAHRAGVHYRFRAEFGGDSDNLAAHSTWVPFRFRP